MACSSDAVDAPSREMDAPTEASNRNASTAAEPATSALTSIAEKAVTNPDSNAEQLADIVTDTTAQPASNISLLEPTSPRHYKWLSPIVYVEIIPGSSDPRYGPPRSLFTVAEEDAEEIDFATNPASSTLAPCSSQACDASARNLDALAEASKRDAGSAVQPATSARASIAENVVTNPQTRAEQLAATVTDTTAQPATQPSTSREITMKKRWADLYTHNCALEAGRWTVFNQELPVGDHDWSKILGPGLSPGQRVVKSVATFFEDEPDHNKNNAPRLDIVLTLNDGVTIRYHPNAALIYSTETQPTKAMQQRHNLANALRRKYVHMHG